MAESVGYYAVPANEQGGTGQPVAARRGGGPRSETQSDTDEWTREYSRSGRSDPYGEEPRDRDAFGQAGAKQATRKYPNGRSKRPQTREKPDQYNYGDEDDYNDFLEDSREPKPRR
ncbi:MAG: hypothetical protein FWG37_01980, partial [Clostridia bacterium]|nr:hypothetical protein [Clostridia bacterium]